MTGTLKVTGSTDELWGIDIRLGRDAGDPTVSADHAEVKLHDGDAELICYPSDGARDCDGYGLRLLEARIRGVQDVKLCGGRMTFTGWLVSLGYFPADQPPVVTADDDGKLWVGSAFPPNQLDLPRNHAVRVFVTAYLMAVQ